MKMLASFTAIALLVAGFSVAQAQNSTSQDTNSSPSSVNKGDLPTKSSGDQKANPSATTGSKMNSPTAETKEKAKSPASMDSGTKQEK